MPTLIRLSVSVLLLLAPLPASSQPDAPAPDTIKIFDAQYGDPDSHRLCDATPVIAAMCDGQAVCTFPVGNALCGDPAFGMSKKLQMAFKCIGSVPQLLIAPEPNTVRLACAAAAGRGRRT